MKKKNKTKATVNHNRAKGELPPGVKLLRTLEGHQHTVTSLAFDPKGSKLASASRDKTVKLWEAQSGTLLRTLQGHQESIFCVAFNPQGRMLASGSSDGAVKLWNPQSGRLLRTLEGHQAVSSVMFDPQGMMLASGHFDNTAKLWDARNGKLLHTLEAPKGKGASESEVLSVAFDPQGMMLACASADKSVTLWDVQTGKLLRALEGHKSLALSVAFDPQGKILASGGASGTMVLWDVRSGKLLHTLEGPVDGLHSAVFSRDSQFLASNEGNHRSDSDIRHIWLWSCDNWDPITRIPITATSNYIQQALAFHPTLPLLAAGSSRSDTPDKEQCPVIHLWELDISLLLGQRDEAASIRAVHHTTSKIVLVGDHSVGKSALGYRLIHGAFKEQASTHGQQFWVFPSLGQRRADGTECEAILWDFAGQPDYRLVHALFVDNADLALVLFDASDLRDPLHGVDFWLKQLQTGQLRCPIILVAAQTDRGSCSLTSDELTTFCRRHGIHGPIVTSAFTGLGMEELVDQMKAIIPWEEKAATVTTTTFKRVKDYVLGLKEADTDGRSIVTPGELRFCLESTDADWHFTDAEMLAAVGHLENYGYVKRLRTSQGEQRVLLRPELLNNLASSFVLEARRNPKGLGALEEKRLLHGDYNFPELIDLHEEERDVLLDSAALLFLEHNVCFRETDPLRMEPYLVFPELINLKKPPEEVPQTEEGVVYTVSGPTENVFASLVVLLGYTHTFTRTSQWHNNARYEVGDGLVCGFRQETERDGEVHFVLCFGSQVGTPVRTLFQGLFESFLARRNLTVMRHEPLYCVNAECNQLMDRSVVRQRLKEGKTFAFCNECGVKLALPTMSEQIQLTREVQIEVDSQRFAAEQRSRFEQAVFRVRAYVDEQKITPPECFISYAWGVAEHERWVEKRLATDLQKAGVEVVLDRWHNAQIGASVARFVERIEKSNRIVMVGTPLYRRKYENKEASTGYVVAAEVDLIANRLIGTEEQKESVLPLLLEGEKASSLPPLLHGRVYADFRNESMYFMTAFDLILSLYQLPPNHPAVADLRESLRGPEMG